MPRMRQERSATIHGRATRNTGRGMPDHVEKFHFNVETVVELKCIDLLRQGLCLKHRLARCHAADFWIEEWGQKRGLDVGFPNRVAVNKGDYVTLARLNADRERRTLPRILDDERAANTGKALLVLREQLETVAVAVIDRRDDLKWVVGKPAVDAAPKH